jgi:GntR family transcriptional repressor for pyruvate dehydrogenase complex
MGTVFKKVKLQKVSEEVAGQIRNLVKDGKLQPGEKLPPERVFSEMLGVGRSSLREAINILETQGFVETRKRQGVYICSLGSSIISDPLRQILKEDKNKLLQLYEVRKDIELASASAAAEHRTPADIEKMEQVLEKMEMDAQKSTLVLYDDLEFHLAIARSGQNIFRNHILKNIFDISDAHLQNVMGIMIGEKARILGLLQQHQAIFTAIEQQNSSLACAAMATHLTWVEEQWKLLLPEKIMPS